MSVSLHVVLGFHTGNVHLHPLVFTHYQLLLIWCTFDNANWRYQNLSTRIALSLGK